MQVHWVVDIVTILIEMCLPSKHQQLDSATIKGTLAWRTISMRYIHRDTHGTQPAKHYTQLLVQDPPIDKQMHNEIHMTHNTVHTAHDRLYTAQNSFILCTIHNTQPTAHSTQGVHTMYYTQYTTNCTQLAHNVFTPCIICNTQPTSIQTRYNPTHCKQANHVIRDSLHPNIFFTEFR